MQWERNPLPRSTAAGAAGVVTECKLARQQCHLRQARRTVQQARVLCYAERHDMY
jgi:hypothetical protein